MGFFTYEYTNALSHWMTDWDFTILHVTPTNFSNIFTQQQIPNSFYLFGMDGMDQTMGMDVDLDPPKLKIKN